MSEIDQQFIEFVVKSLVGKPDAVSIKRTIDEKGVLLELTVDPEDLGRVIGKRGATAQSLRTLLRALGTKNDARYNLKIVDNGVEGPKRAERDEPATDSRAEDVGSSQQAVVEDDAAASSEPLTANSDNDTSLDEIADAKEEQEPEDHTSDRLKKAREELADLDDLDV